MQSCGSGDLLKKANGDIAKIEKELGIDVGAWQNKELVRIDIPNPKELNARLPDGKELGANSEWIPGGYLPTGYSEAVTNNIPKGKYIENSIK